MSKLNQRQQSFVLNYIKCGFNAYQAAKLSGYSESTARDKSHELAKHPGIQAQIAQSYSQVEIQHMKELNISVAEKAKHLMSIVNDVLGDADNLKRDYYKDAIKAIQELNKMAGHYAPDRRVSLTVDATKGRVLEAKRIYKDF